MGVEQIADWSRGMMAAGRPGDTPVVIVSRCSWPDQQVASSTLAMCAADAGRQGWRSPAMLLVGEAVAAAAAGPLGGQQVIVTRPAGQEGELVAAIRAVGGQPVHVPVIQIADPPSWAPLDAALGRLDTYDWIVLASGNGVRGLVTRLRASGRDGRALASARLAAIGPATQRALEEAGFICDLVPDDHRSEGLLAAFAGEPRGCRFLLVRAAAGRAAGHHVDEVAAYASEPIPQLDRATALATSAGDSGWITVTSGAIAESAARLFGGRMREWRIASLSPVISAVLRRFGLEPAVEAAEPSVAALVAAIIRHEQRSGTGPAHRPQPPQAAASSSAAPGRTG